MHIPRNDKRLYRVLVLIAEYFKEKSFNIIYPDCYYFGLITGSIVGLFPTTHLL